MKNNNYHFALLIFALFDVGIGIIISKISEKKDDNNNKKKENHNYSASSYYLELIYLFNPISILNCVNLRLDIFYTFLNLIFISQKNNFLGPFYLMISLVTSPGYIFINIFTLIYFFINCEIKNKVNFFLKLIFSFFLITFLINFSKMNFEEDVGSNFFYNLSKALILMKNCSITLFEDTKLIYHNYYFVKDTLPNVGLFWSLIPETFLKFQNFTCILLINYQILICVAIFCLVNQLQNSTLKNKFSLFYSLLLLANHIIDRYPAENVYIISLILISQHADIVKEKIFGLAMYGTIAGYSLMLSRGYFFRVKRMGSSNYLFFQNLTYSAFLIFVLLVAIHSVNEFIKRNKNINKVKNLLYALIQKAVEKNNK